MRIIAGKWRGRRLKIPPLSVTRPTTDRVREAVFSMLTSRADLEESLVVDVFAGSGAMGLEALSRGAAYGLFAEKDPVAFKIVTDNIACIVNKSFAGTVPQTQVFKDYQLLPPLSALPVPLSALKQIIIFMDPPYNQELDYKAFDHLQKQGYIAPETFIVVETENTYPDFPLRSVHQKCFGRCAISLWQMG